MFEEINNHREKFNELESYIFHLFSTVTGEWLD